MGFCIFQFLPRFTIKFLLNCCFFLSSFHPPTTLLLFFFLFRPTTSTFVFLMKFTSCFAASYAGTSGVSNSMANSIGIGSAVGECRDYTGRTIQHAMHFVPPGVDMCKLCICENGHAKVFTSKTRPSLSHSAKCFFFVCAFFSVYRRVELFFAHPHLIANHFKWAHHAVNSSA